MHGGDAGGGHAGGGHVGGHYSDVGAEGPPVYPFTGPLIVGPTGRLGMVGIVTFLAILGAIGGLMLYRALTAGPLVGVAVAAGIFGFGTLILWGLRNRARN